MWVIKELFQGVFFFLLFEYGLWRPKKPEEEIKEASASRPADKDIGDKESPKQGSSVKPEITDGPKQDSKPSIKEGLISDLDSEGMRARASRLGKKKGKVSKEKLAKELPAALRKEKQKKPHKISDECTREKSICNRTCN